jgi:hypothetical protein
MVPHRNASMTCCCWRCWADEMKASHLLLLSLQRHLPSYAPAVSFFSDYYKVDKRVLDLLEFCILREQVVQLNLLIVLDQEQIQRWRNEITLIISNLEKIKTYCEGDVKATMNVMLKISGMDMVDEVPF